MIAGLILILAIAFISALPWIGKRALNIIDKQADYPDE